MSRVYEIPLKSGAPQSLSIALGRVVYQLVLVYRKATDGGWFLDIADANSNAILSGIPLVTGADLLAQHKHLGIAGELWVQTSSDPDAAPTFEGLGQDSKLYFVTSP